MDVRVISAEAKPPRASTFKDSEWRALARFWHPVARSAHVKDKPVAAKLLDENLVVFRTSLGVTVARDICLHRGAKLSLGEMAGDELVCGFHGFHYDHSGHCTRIPAHPGIPIPGKLCLQTFASVERYGLVWACLAADPMVPLPEWPEYEGGAYELIPMDPVDWNASAGRHTENFNDVAHLSWVHTGTFGHRETPEVIRYPVTEKEHRLSIIIPEANQHDRDVRGKRPDTVSKVRYEQTIDIPFASRLLVDYHEGRHLYFFDVVAPLSAASCRIFVTLGRNFGFEDPPQDFIDYTLAVFMEDSPFVESQCPQDLPLDLHDEVHIPADLLSVRYRQKLKMLGLGEQFFA
jgi:phenylpropionate dioxygenase-like ring-hydroxylating dioxygenase large terminal subunit